MTISRLANVFPVEVSILAMTDLIFFKFLVNSFHAHIHSPVTSLVKY